MKPVKACGAWAKPLLPAFLCTLRPYFSATCLFGTGFREMADPGKNDRFRYE
ncbi:hypothetical protein SAMN05444008_10737 [Cnuella takakiae]|uniref:Uncharacterized protein n=1 Tax=Cnuella takakiae TaxID=1302690 RepID=A0A1M5AXL5_9BACT|nr:hypothetical protein SAMN05444008_10737 [Cnuella takakiae]